MKIISHDAFARTELIRQRIYITMHEKTVCEWCGNVNKTKNGEKYLYIYGSSPDDKPLRTITGKAFCCVDCYRAYYGIDL